MSLKNAANRTFCCGQKKPQAELGVSVTKLVLGITSYDELSFS